MYNHYQTSSDYVAVGTEAAAHTVPPRSRERRLSAAHPGESSKNIHQFFSGITDYLKLDNFDTGDILLILIILFLLLEGDNLELIITLGLLLLLGLGDSEGDSYRPVK